MGPKNSAPLQEDNPLKIHHQMFNNVKLVKDKEDQEVIVSQVRLPNKQQFDIWAKRVDEVPFNQSLMLPIHKQYKQEGICGSSGVALIAYENFPYLLSEEITNRAGLNKKLFEENELWYLVFTLLSASSTYHKQDRKVGDIRPDNIFINEDGQVKVASVDSWPGEKSNYEKSFYEKQITYLSPEEVKDYQFGRIDESGSKQLAETFSIGLTCLDAGTLSESTSLYSKYFKFDYQKLFNRLKQFKQYGYSQLLTLTISNMCEVNQEYRSRSQQILAWLLPHQSSIVNLQSFEVTDIPQKMKAVQIRDNQYSKSSFEYKYQNPIICYQTPSSQSFYIPQLFQPIQPVRSKEAIETVQLNNINQQPISSIQSYSQPIQVSYYQPSTLFTNERNFQEGRPIPSVGNTPFGDHKFTLQRIDQQLQQSRKLFPS